MCDISTNPISGFSDVELKTYNAERYNMYRGTISVCIIYAIIALTLILLGYFTQWGHDFILGTILWFTITFIIGTIIIIIYLGYLVNDYKPSKKNTKVDYSNDICPDYWKLVVSNEIEFKKGYISSNVNENLFKYKCVPDDKIFNSKSIVDNNTNKYALDASKHLYVDLSGLPDAIRHSDSGLSNKKRDTFNKYALYMDGYEIHNAAVGATDTNPGVYTVNSLSVDSSQLASLPANNAAVTAGKIPLQCDKVFPLYLASMDKQNSAINSSDPNNVFRCAYSKACGMPWTDAGCASD